MTSADLALRMFPDPRPGEPVYCWWTTPAPIPFPRHQLFPCGQPTEHPSGLCDDHRAGLAMLA